MFAFSFVRAKRLSCLAVVVCVCVVAHLITSALADDNELPQPSWKTACPQNFRFCADVVTYRRWGEYPQDRLTVTVNALMNDPNNKGIATVWLLMDDPDVEFAKELQKKDFNVIFINPRGTKLSSTYYACEDTKDSHDAHCWVSDKCAKSIAARNAESRGLYNASHFTADQVAHDVHHIISSSLGEGRKNVLLAQGLSSMFALRVLQLYPNTNFGIMAVDYVHPFLFDSFGYLSGAGMEVALEQLLSLCDDDVRCVGRLGAGESTWKRLQTLRALASANKLTCAKKLNWGSSRLWGASFADQFRSVLSLMMRYPVYPFRANDNKLMSLIPSMLYRLQRCNKEDIEALNKLYNYVTTNQGYKCPDDIYVQTLWLKNEFTHASPPKNPSKFWEAAAKERAVLPAVGNVNAYHDTSAKFPFVPRSEAAKTMPVNATQKILLISADVDTLAPRGAAAQVAIGFRELDNSVRAVQLRGIANQPVAVLMPCIINNLQFYRQSESWANADQCTLEPLKKLDFLNGASKEYYGVDDSWSYDKPNSDDGSSRGGSDEGQTSKIRTFFRVVLLLLLLAALGAGGYYGYNQLRDRGFRFRRVSDNFYDNLHT